MHTQRILGHSDPKLTAQHYTDLGVASGQTIRLLPEETSGSPIDGDGLFPIVLLTLE